MSPDVYHSLPKTKKEAQKSHAKYYFTGEPCRNGHTDKRGAKSGVCCACSRERTQKVSEYNKLWRKTNSNRVAENGRQWRKRNKDSISKSKSEWRKQNPIKVSSHNRNWRQKNPSKCIISSRIRNQLLDAAIPTWFEEELIKQIYLKRDELNKKWNSTFQVDHVIPLHSNSVCGLHCWSNLQLLDKSLNGSKNNTYQTDW